MDHSDKDQRKSSGVARAHKVTSTSLRRVGNFLRDLGLSVQAVDVLPDKVRIHTGNDSITLSDEDELDKQLQELRARHGYG